MCAYSLCQNILLFLCAQLAHCVCNVTNLKITDYLYIKSYDADIFIKETKLILILCTLCRLCCGDIHNLRHNTLGMQKGLNIYIIKYLYTFLRLLLSHKSFFRVLMQYLYNNSLVLIKTTMLISTPTESS